MPPPTTNPATTRLATEVIAAWKPEQGIHLTPLTAGYAGAMPYKVELGDRAYCLKVPLLHPEPPHRRIKGGPSIKAEAERSRWAAALGGVAAKVHHVDEARDAFVVDFIEGCKPSPEAARGPLLAPLARTIRAVHAGPVHTVPDHSDGKNINWLFGQRPETKDSVYPQPLSRAARHALVQHDAFLDKALAHASPWRTPIHDDLHPGNMLALGVDRLMLVDWDNLKIGDPLQDLGHAAAHVQLPATQLHRLQQAYEAAPASNRERLLTPSVDAGQLALWTNFFRFRSVVFHLEYSPCEDERQLLATDMVHLTRQFAEVGYRPDPLMCHPSQPWQGTR